MPKRVQFIRHTTAQADVFTGKEGEITVDLDNDELRVHDSTTAGGIASARKDMANVAEATSSNDGKMTAARITELTAATSKLATIESGATADQTAGEIKTAYESNADTNEYSDAEEAKLAGIEAGATADQSDAEIKVAYEANADTNAFTNALLSKLNGIEASATADQTGAEIKSLYEAEANAFTDALFTKLAGIETAAKDDQTGAEIKALLYALADTNNLTDALLTKLNGIETAATADQTGAQIKTALFAESDTNNLTDALLTLLNAGGAKRVLLSSTAISGSPTTVTMTGIDATYKRYELELDRVVPGTDNDFLSTRVGTGGGPTIQSGSVYTALGSATLTTRMRMTSAATSNVAGEGGISGIIEIHNAPDAIFTRLQTHLSNVFASSITSDSNNLSAMYHGTTAVTAIQLLWQAGGIFTGGNVRLYGID